MSHAAHDPQAAHDPHGQAAHGDHGGLMKYVYVFIALCVLSTGSFITTSKSLFPFDQHVAWAFMMAVSCGKALLVVLFFMHVKYEASWKYVLTIPASIMAVFLALALVPDIGLRRRLYSDERSSFAAEPPAAATEPGRANHDGH